MNAVTQITERAEPKALDLKTHDLLFDFSMIEKMNDLAKLMATSKVAVPAHFRNSPGDCLAVVMQAVQWGMNPFSVAQKCFVINGTIGYEAQLVNAVINSLAPVKGRLEYEWFGDWTKVIGKFEIKKGDKGEYRTPGWKLADEEGLGVRVWATLKGENEPRTLELLLAQARTRNSTLWADDPKTQLAYLAIKKWARLFCPDVLLGVYTPDELEEIQERDITQEAQVVERTPSSRAESAKDKLRAKAAAKPAPDHRAWTRSMLAKLAGATGKDTLAPIRAEIEGYAECPERAEVWEAYKARVNEIKAEFEARQSAATDEAQGTLFEDAPVDTSTGEIGLGEVDLLKMVDTAADGEELDGVLDLARSANLKETAYKRVIESADKRRASFNG